MKIFKLQAVHGRIQIVTVNYQPLMIVSLYLSNLSASNLRFKLAALEDSTKTFFQ